MRCQSRRLECASAMLAVVLRGAASCVPKSDEAAFKAAGLTFVRLLADGKLDEALAERPNATCRLFDDLNHLFAPGQGKATLAEYLEENHIDPRVIDLIAGWCAP